MPLLSNCYFQRKRFIADMQDFTSSLCSCMFDRVNASSHTKTFEWKAISWTETRENNENVNISRRRKNFVYFPLLSTWNWKKERDFRTMETDNRECQLQFVSFSSFHFGSRIEQWISVIFLYIICHRYQYRVMSMKAWLQVSAPLFCDCLPRHNTSRVLNHTVPSFSRIFHLSSPQFVVLLSSGPTDTQSNRNHSSEDYYPFPTQNDEMEERETDIRQYLG